MGAENKVFGLLLVLYAYIGGDGDQECGKFAYLINGWSLSAIYIKTYPRQSAYNDLFEKNRVCRHEFKSDTVSENIAQGHPERG